MRNDSPQKHTSNNAMNRGAINSAISVCEGGELDCIDPFSNQIRMVWECYVMAQGGLVKHPPDGEKSFLSLLQHHDKRMKD
jgi:hypothetical protein